MGMGGGTILITFLTCFMNVNQLVAQSSNIIFFIPTSIIATIINIKNKKLNWRIAIPLAVSGVIGAIFGSIVANKINYIFLRKTFAIFLIIIAIYELIYWYRKYVKNT